jgi:hypothetical protein
MLGHQQRCFPGVRPFDRNDHLKPLSRRWHQALDFYSSGLTLARRTAEIGAEPSLPAGVNECGGLNRSGHPPDGTDIGGPSPKRTFVALDEAASSKKLN